MTLDPRKLNRHQLTGPNMHMISFDPSGNIADDIVWVAPNQPGQTFGTVSHYRSLGYRPVEPKECDTLPGGTYRPKEGKRWGVLFDFDPKASDVRNALNMVMMHCPPGVREEMEAEAARTQAGFSRQESKAQIMGGNASNPRLMLATEETNENPASITS